MISNILGIKKGITSIIGSGGKTTLMCALANELSKNGRVIICTTTKIFRPERIMTFEELPRQDSEKIFFENNPICVGTFIECGKISIPRVDLEKLAEIADYIICESDGAKGMPLKAHSQYEPLIHRKSVDILGVLGIDGIGGRIIDVCHRPELYAKMLKTSVFDRIRPEMAARIIKEENLCKTLIINQVENSEKLESAKRIASCLDMPVFAGELRKGELTCLHL
ncbi:hypothetical protein IMSAG049_00686 [Clostridiales bacterium]|nr:hypothetical protein IMSAG049_00686 [Clostridiales bacterium]